MLDFRATAGEGQSIRDRYDNLARLSSKGKYVALTDTKGNLYCGKVENVDDLIELSNAYKYSILSSSEEDAKPEKDEKIALYLGRIKSGENLERLTVPKGEFEDFKNISELVTEMHNRKDIREAFEAQGLTGAVEVPVKEGYRVPKRK
ncbi:hypothetical protein KY347_01255 [Candidatus Woesearchaeota archaeon]|nr:hypothetical protein [Candidatus Woesearchaeota archaeon]